jgi:large subunit ribosomal protein L10
MKKEDKAKVIEQLTELLQTYPHAYLVDATALNAEQTTALRRTCFQHGVKMMVVKNTLLHRAFIGINEEQYAPFTEYLKGNSALMLSETANAPARAIKDFRKEAKAAGAELTVPDLKAAYVYDTFYFGGAEIDTLASLKSKEELLGEIVSLLESPLMDVLSQLSSAGDTIHGVLETLEKKPETAEA